MPGPFDKDFGYLLPFLDKVAQAANSISNPAASKELKELVAGEKVRWMRIRDLLENPSGAAGQPAGTFQSQAAGEASASGPVRPAPPRFTVGRLKGRDR